MSATYHDLDFMILYFAFCPNLPDLGVFDTGKQPLCFGVFDLI